MKKFNTTGICKPDIHYMVDIGERLKQIKNLVDDGEYFVINRARQYGKTTTLMELKKFLAEDYTVVLMDFQRQMSSKKFQDEIIFSQAFLEAFLKKWKIDERDLKIKEKIEETRKKANELDLVELFDFFAYICENSLKPIVLIVDEVDSASNNQVFLDFLGQLRGAYLEREEQGAFHSVILAGVYDIKNLKGKLRSEDEHKINSPWNIAADFDVDMSLSEAGIVGMLQNYEKDYQTGMDIGEIAKLLYDYTSGYPFLVSRICKLIDEKITCASSYKDAWTKNGFYEALKLLYSEKNTLFDLLMHRMEENQILKQLLYEVLFVGKQILYNPDNPVIEKAAMNGFIKNQNGMIMVANRIFETRLYNMFLSTNEALNTEAYEIGIRNKSQFIVNGRLDMQYVLQKFVEYFSSIYSEKDRKFIENEGRKLFLLYLRPIINGVGNYYIEAQTRDLKRTDVIVDYNGEQFIIELKIWHGDVYHQKGEEQLVDYLEFHGLKIGYMLSFNFNKNKECGIKTIQYKDKVLVEAFV